MTFSTRSSGGLQAWPLAQIPDPDLAALLRIPASTVKSARKKREAELSDATWVGATLDKLPAATLAALGALVELGGIATVEEVAMQIGMARLSATDVELALIPATADLLVVPLTSRWGELSAVLVSPAASHVATALRDVALPELADALFVDDDDGGGERARGVLATCAAMAQLDVKLTIDGMPHRTPVKRLAKQIGLTEEAVESALLLGLQLGWLAPDDEHLLRPSGPALEAAALGRYPGLPAIDAIRDHLASTGPLAEAAVERWLGRQPVSLGAEGLAMLPGFCRGTVAGVPAIRVRGLAGSAAGHVTPSFEVFLPPDSRPLDLVRVLGACDLVRIDRMIVARITKTSIGRSGMSRDGVLAILREAIRTPVPQNVESAIGDWVKVVTRAATATGRVVVVPVEAAARVRSALAPFAARELAAGVFVVDPATPQRALTTALAHVDVRAEVAQPTVAAQATVALPAPPGRSRHRRRVSAWACKHAFDGAYDDFLERARAATKRAPAPPPPRASQPVAGRELLRQLRSWERRYGVKLAERERVVLLEALASKSPMIVETIFEAYDVAGLFDRIRMLLGETLDGDGDDDDDELDLGDLDWHRNDLLGRLQRAAHAKQPLFVDHTGGAERVSIAEVRRQGAVWMVLGEGEQGLALALRLDQIHAVADVPGAPPRTRWRPGAGEPLPAGHLPCPCGSGTRFRNCCRDAAPS